MVLQLNNIVERKILSRKEGLKRWRELPHELVLFIQELACRTGGNGQLQGWFKNSKVVFVVVKNNRIVRLTVDGDEIQLPLFFKTNLDCSFSKKKS